ncbi:MAG: EF-hand domain-containing protein [Burkholderiaceae bacterium]
MSKLISIVVGSAFIGASAFAVAQTSTTPSGMTKPAADMTPSATQYSIDYKAMDANGDGMISRDEYMRYYGTRYDRMKRNDKGMVMMNDMMMSDGAHASTAGGTSNITNNPTTNRPGTKGGVGNPPATGGGSK